MNKIILVLAFMFLGCFADDAQKCKNGDYNACFKIFKPDCDLNDGLACSGLGSLYVSKKDYTKAFEYLKKGCDLNNGFACSGLEDLYYFGEGVRQDKFKAKEYFGRCCDSGKQICCDKYRELNEQGY